MTNPVVLKHSRSFDYRAERVLIMLDVILFKIRWYEIKNKEIYIMDNVKARELYNPNKHICITKFKGGKGRIWTVETNPKFGSTILHYDFIDKDSLKRYDNGLHTKSILDTLNRQIELLEAIEKNGYGVKSC